MNVVFLQLLPRNSKVAMGKFFHQTGKYLIVKYNPTHDRQHPRWIITQSLTQLMYCLVSHTDPIRTKLLPRLLSHSRYTRVVLTFRYTRIPLIMLKVRNYLRRFHIIPFQVFHDNSCPADSLEKQMSSRSFLKMKVDRPVMLPGNSQDQIILSLTQSQSPASKSILIKLELRCISPDEGEHANYLNHMEMPHCKTTHQIKAYLCYFPGRGSN